MIRIERHPSRGQLHVFGLLWFVFFCFWGTLSWWEAGMNAKAAAFWAIAFIIPSAGFVWPEVLRKVYLLAVYVTFPIGIIISSVLLIFVYYIVLTPISLILRLTGYDPMGRFFDRTAKTYWLPRKPKNETERYFKQF